jgi:hypothetical protein
MKKYTRFSIILTILALLAAPALFGQETYDSPLFAPVTPEVTAQGGSFTAVARGYNSLFTNPAGFSRDGGSFTLLSANATAYVPPGKIGELPTFANDPEAGISAIEQTILETGFGGAGSVGTLGIVGNGFGLGLVSNIDVYGRPVGTTAGSTEVDLTYTTGAIAGMAVPLNLLGMQVHVGGDVRYIKRAEVRDLGILTAMDMLNGQSVTLPANSFAGDGIGFDLGAIAELGDFTVGASVRDLFGTEMGYTDISGMSSDQMFAYPEGSEITDTYVIPMSVNIGASWHLDLGGLAFLADPTIHLDWQHVMYQERNPSIWTELHAGAEVKVLRFIKLRAGINQGYITMGAGMKLLFMDLNVSYFGREMSDWPGIDPSQGVALEAAIRF